MRDFCPALPLAVALSGGADSTALLLACAEKWPGQVLALHVNHGLQAAAADFERQCRLLCQQLNVPLGVQHVDARHASGDSPEDAARRARYAAFDALSRVEYGSLAIKSVALAQHADDQVETFLLALSRGAGLGGLSAMPAHWRRHGIDYHRPFLAVAQQDIRAWLGARHQGFVEDPSNQDQRYTRNRIRAQLVPALATCFPQYRKTVARSVAHVAEAQALLEEVADLDCLSVCCPTGGQPRIRGLQELSRPRQANLVRRWLKLAYQVVPSTVQLAALLDQVEVCRTRGHHIHLKVAGGFVERRAEVLDWYNPKALLSRN